MPFSRQRAKVKAFESGTLPSASSIGSAGVLAVKVVLNEDEDTDKLISEQPDRSPSTPRRFPRSIS